VISWNKQVCFLTKVATLASQRTTHSLSLPPPPSVSHSRTWYQLPDKIPRIARGIYVIKPPDNLSDVDRCPRLTQSLVVLSNSQ